MEQALYLIFRCFDVLFIPKNLLFIMLYWHFNFQPYLSIFIIEVGTSPTYKNTKTKQDADFKRALIAPLC